MRHSASSVTTPVIDSFRRLAAGTALATMAGLAGPASAQAPQVIYACVQQSSQQVRIVSASEACRQTEARLQWNVAGPVGPQGPQGPKGDPGAPADMSVVATMIDQKLAPLSSQLATLTSKASALEALTQQFHNVSVNCGSGETIANALTQSSAHLGLVVIDVFGTCTENVNVTRAKTVIRAGAPGATIMAQDANSPVVQISSPGVATYLSLSGLTISGGRIGVLATNGSVVRLTGSSVVNNVLGVQVNDGAYALISGSVLSNNSDFGLQLQFGAVADVGGGSQINSNQGGTGIRGAVGVYGGSMLRLSNTTISQNTGNGIFAVAGSSVWLESGVVIDRNGGNGVSLSDTTIMGKFFVTTGIQVTNNQRYGISCTGAAQLYGFPPVGSGVVTMGQNVLGDFNNCQTSTVP